MKLLERCGASSCVILFCASILSAQDGEPLYKRTCAACHDSGAERVPGRETLKAMTPERVLAAMESGAMIAMASRLSVGERRAVAEFITGKSLGRASGQYARSKRRNRWIHGSGGPASETEVGFRFPGRRER